MMGGWIIEFGEFDPEEEGRREALCTLANGVFGTRGAAPESSHDETHYPGTYAAGCFNRLVSHVEGVDIEHESMVNLPNWLPLTFRTVGGEWLGGGGPAALDRRQALDLRRGVLLRDFRVEDAEGRRTLVSERRLVSMADPPFGALEWTITPENWSGALEVRSAIDGSVENRNVADEHELAGRHLRVADRGFEGSDVAWLAAETTQSRIRVAVAARTRVIVDGERSAPLTAEWLPVDGVGVVLTVEAMEGRPVVVEKVAALATSRDPAISEPVAAVGARIEIAGSFEDLLERHALAWEHLWRRCHLELSCPDDAVARILNLHVFHVLQSLSPNVVDRDVGVPARGLHGEAYRGHIFWDELFIFPFLNLRLPELTRETLLYRYRRLDAARRLAVEEGRRGAMFPWQSGSDGREETPTRFWNPRSRRWMRDDSRRQRHVGLAVAYNVWQYYQVSGDTAFLAGYGAEMLVEIARFFADLAEHDPKDDRFHIRGVMGPDEFQDGYPDRPGEGIDDNAYTNVMVSWLLRRAADTHDILGRHHGAEVLERLDVDPDEMRHWDRVSRRLHVPFLAEGIVAQFEGFADLEELDWDGYRARYGNIGRLDQILEAEGDTVNRYKASKQADVLMLFYLFSSAELTDLLHHLGYPFDPDAIPPTIDYYLARTTNGSSLSRVAHAWVLSRADRERSWELLREALEVDIADTQRGTTREGIHLGAMAGTIDLVQRCYSGIETNDGILRLNPQLPNPLGMLRFVVRYRGHWLDIEITHTLLRVESRVCDLSPLRLGLGTSVVELAPGTSIEAALPLDTG